TQPNRNRLLWLDPTVDGMKTGHTEAAGYCLISSAKRGPRRLVSVVLGTASDSVRAQESLKLLNYGFQFYDAVQLYAKNQTVSSLKVWKGQEAVVKAGFTSDFILAVPKGYGPKIKAELVSQQPLVAPVTQGQVVGTMKVSIDGKPYGDYPVLAIEAVPVAGFFGRLIDTIRMWFN
ncbi:MAG TPA: D-alanyl-D-alanine carboxypeptidase, partial [Azonexus sp.]|nr:D-alanyl-D-alanine carboxypeptidase [Azonexus sp.]